MPSASAILMTGERQPPALDRVGFVRPWPQLGQVQSSSPSRTVKLLWQVGQV